MIKSLLRIINQTMLTGLGGGALSSVNLLIERAPPLSNSLHAIYLVPLLIAFLYCFNFL